MEVLYILVGVPLFVGVCVAFYEWRTKRVLLQHDLNQRARQDGHTQAAQIQAEDATIHRIMGFDR